MIHFLAPVLEHEALSITTRRGGRKVGQFVHGISSRVDEGELGVEVRYIPECWPSSEQYMFLNSSMSAGSHEPNSEGTFENVVEYQESSSSFRSNLQPTTGQRNIQKSPDNRGQMEKKCNERKARIMIQHTHRSYRYLEFSIDTIGSHIDP
jgi:hypothetical protein